MKNILVIGAGRSSGALIDYLLTWSVESGANIVVADLDLGLAQSRIHKHSNGKAISIKVDKEGTDLAIIQSVDIVISMMPPSLHVGIAKQCLDAGKHFVTASYLSQELKGLDLECKNKNLVFMNEIGLDPGIDHLSAMQLIDEIKANGGKIKGFLSYCGGLIAPESDTNPWHYKITWNPRNVVLAGQGTAQFLKDGKVCFLPYNRLFKETETLDFEELGAYEGYANRDSLTYKDAYGIEDVQTMIRGTIRGKGFCEAWDVLVDLGYTDHSTKITQDGSLSFRAFTAALFPSDCLSIGDYCQRTERSNVIREMLESLGLWDENLIEGSEFTPAEVLEQLMLKKWKFEDTDKDMVLMRHLFQYEKGGKDRTIVSEMKSIGEGHGGHSAMSRTVGLPMGIFVKHLAMDMIKRKGVLIPIHADIYQPILNELKDLGIEFRHIETN